MTTPTHLDLRRLAAVVALLGCVGGGPRSAAQEDETPAARGAREVEAGTRAFSAARYDEAERHWAAALEAYEIAQDAAQQARLLRNLTFLPRLPWEDRLALLQRALPLVSAAGDLRLEGLVLHNMGDVRFNLGDYAGAMRDTTHAVTLLEAGASPQELARALTSLARLARVQGAYAAARDHAARASALLEGTGDASGASQAAIGTALAASAAGDEPDALAQIERAVRLARSSAMPAALANALGNQMQLLTRAGRPQEALRIGGEALAVAPTSQQRSLILGNRAEALNASGQLQDALAAIDAALASSEGLAPENLMGQHAVRATILERLGRMAEAVDSAGAATAIIETTTRRLTPEDFLKRGYADRVRDDHARYVRLLALNGRHGEALEAAERARGRALLDLLAARAASFPAASAPLPAPATADRAPSTDGASPDGAPKAYRADRWIVRGGSGEAVPVAPPSPASATVAAPTLAEMRATLTALGSHLLAYWVDDHETLIWVMSQDGAVTAARVAIERTALGRLVQQTAGPDSRRAFQELYRRLIAPVRAALPTDPGAMLTIVPHGVLHRLSFAALQAPSGRYLLEDVRVHYTPALGALLPVATTTGAAEAKHLVVADPMVPAALAESDDLIRLPGAAVEGLGVASEVGSGRVTLLSGRGASERAVRAAAPEARVLHFATHGVVHDDAPFASYIGLAGSGAAADDDGRLTAAEVYDLRLDADLVVLSACRTADGPVSGDGVLGFTRALTAAGARRVVASLWDVPDGPTSELVRQFYRRRERAVSTSAALRDAQLWMLRRLRAGHVSVTTPAGRFAVPEIRPCGPASSWCANPKEAAYCFTRIGPRRP